MAFSNADPESDWTWSMVLQVARYASYKMASKVYTSALVVALREGTELHERVQSIRRVYDRKFHRWMPHITLLYPFVAVEEFEQTAQCLSSLLAGFPTFTASFSSLGFFSHGRKKYTVFLKPEEETICQLKTLQAICQDAAPHCDNVSARKGGFKPHMTLGQFASRAELDNFLISSWSGSYSCEIDQVHLIHREGQDDPFRILHSVDLSPWCHRITTPLVFQTNFRFFFFLFLSFYRSIQYFPYFYNWNQTIRRVM